MPTGLPLPNPVIVIPGITATYLRDMYPLPPESVWEVMSWDRDFRRVSLHPDDQTAGRRRFEAVEPARIVPDQLYEVAYKELIDELKHNLCENDKAPVPVYPFGYDWRQPLSLIEAQLDAFIDEVIARTTLLRHYFKAPWLNQPQVNLVGHSMGGLIIAGLLQGKGGDARIGKIVSLAAPFRGSFESVMKISTGNANLGLQEPSSRDREAARVTPALYHLLPDFEGGDIAIAPEFGTSLFDPNVWQRSVIVTIAKYIDEYGKDEANPVDAGNVFAAILREAHDHRLRLETLDLATLNVPFPMQNWLCVVGINSKTRVRTTIARGQTGPEFRFDDSETGDIRNDVPNRLTGDGTVPLRGAVPRFISEDRIVCVTPEDFGFWEWKDVALMKAGGGFHGFIPTMDMIQRMIVNFFRPGSRGDYWGRPLPGLVGPWNPPVVPPPKNVG